MKNRRKTTKAPKRTGRPVGAKKSKPHQKKEEPDAQPIDEGRIEEQNRMERDPAHDCYESKRLAVEGARHAQAKHWMNLASRLM